MKICKTILGVVCLLLTGCYEESIESLSVVDEATSHTAYISLNFTTSSKISTRSTTNPPKGGEWGDGREIGQTYENTVTSAAVFLYQDEKGVNGNASTPVTMVSFNTVNGNQNYTNNIDYIATTEPQSVGLENGHYNVLAIANPNDLSWAQAGGLTLGIVREHIEKMAWDETTANNTTSYFSFLMTSENEGEGIEITEENNTEDNPAVAEVDVERMAARVDYQVTGTYTISADEGGDVAYEGAKVEITGATIVNNLTAGSYLLKRVNSGKGEEITYLGLETADNNDMATNYVIDPWTEEKDGASEEVTIDGVKSPISSLYGVYYPGMATSGDEQNPSFWAGLVDEGTPVTDQDGTIWNRVGYTMENTIYQEYTSKDYCTGVVFGAQFTPAEGTVVNKFYEGYTSFVEGETTFFRWNDILYATAEDMMAGAYPDRFVVDDKFGESTFSGIETIYDLEDFIATLYDNDPTGYKTYLESFVDFPEIKDSLYWENYIVNRCHYYYDTELNELILGEDCRALLFEATNEMVQTYENSQCYYTWWLRHSNDDSNETNGVMEYAIVRNNIYKLDIESVYTLGGDVPDDGLRIRVYVRKWEMYEKETIDL